MSIYRCIRKIEVERIKKDAVRSQCVIQLLRFELLLLQAGS
jgi:hypothetical protein